MTTAQQLQQGIEYLLRNIDNTYEDIENIPNRLSMTSNPNAPQRLEGIGTVFEWPVEGSVVTEDLQPESGVNKTFDKLHIRNAPRILMGDARYREYSWYEEYRSKIIHVMGISRKLRGDCSR